MALQTPAAAALMAKRRLGDDAADEEFTRARSPWGGPLRRRKPPGATGPSLV